MGYRGGNISVDEVTLHDNGSAVEVKDSGLTEAKMAEAAVQTLTNGDGGFTLQHNNRSVLLVTVNAMYIYLPSSETAAIADGSVVGQCLTILFHLTYPGQATLALKDNANTNLQGDFRTTYGDGSLAVVWDGTNWVEDTRSYLTNTNSGDVSGSAGGANNVNSGEKSGSIGGDAVANSGDGSGSAGGQSHTNGGDLSGSVGGSGMTNSGSRCGSVGGQSNENIDSYCGSVGGRMGRTRHAAESLQASYRRGATGDTQKTTFILRGDFDEGAVPAWHELTTPERWTLEEGRTVLFRIAIVGRKSDGSKHAAYLRQALMYRNAGGNATLVGSVQTVGMDIESDTAWDVRITADATYQSIRIEVEAGVNDGTVYWQATMEPHIVG